ncbi:hypothetical protein JI664_03605 [Rhodobacter sp. NTK016B]|uniref:hypothetical protein n=1 Tax=Rhodobacter sp. NTK016B TaxID=2759676 RepID=UPI001A8CF794|nr:hypothetical protein [Rhodobacter sp. NTK016B]MBN8291043.1 hypothetical protein [Rhodobacter sp. NTK016B]
MTTRADQVGNAPAAHSAAGQGEGFDFESFVDFAFAELAACPLSEPGRCANPDCARPFNAAREWQLYCSRACREADERERRRVGQKAAPALLAHRLGKYIDKRSAEQDAEARARRDLSAAARRYIGQLQSAWLHDRKARAMASRRRWQ